MAYLTAVLVAGILVLAWNLYRAHVTIATLTLEANAYKIGYGLLINCIELAAKLKRIEDGMDEKDR